MALEMPFVAGGSDQQNPEAEQQREVEQQQVVEGLKRAAVELDHRGAASLDSK